MDIIDLHCDTLSELREARSAGGLCGLRENGLHIDLSRLKKGGYALQTFAAFVNLNDRRPPLESCLELIDIFYEETGKNAGKVIPVASYSDIMRARSEGKLAALLSVEEGGVCAGNPAVLRMLYRLGVRMMTLTWNYENELGYPNLVPGEGNTVFPCEADGTHGLKERGFEFVGEMERLGIIVDVSHLSDAGFRDVASVASKPFIASHSNARALCRHCRNLTDGMIREIGSRGGIIGINYCASFLEEAENEDACRSTVEGMVAHMRHIASVGGTEAVALGSDFDGISRNLELYDASCMQRLYDGILRGGFSPSDAEKICCGNALRLFRELL